MLRSVDWRLVTDVSAQSYRSHLHGSSSVPTIDYIWYSYSVLCGCETWSLTLREERRLRVFENRVLRRMFGSKRDEVTEDWKKLQN